MGRALGAHSEDDLTIVGTGRGKFQVQHQLCADAFKLDVQGHAGKAGWGWSGTEEEERLEGTGRLGGHRGWRETMGHRRQQSRE